MDVALQQMSRRLNGGVDGNLRDDIREDLALFIIFYRHIASYLNLERVLGDDFPKITILSPRLKMTVIARIAICHKYACDQSLVQTCRKSPFTFIRYFLWRANDVPT